MLTLDYKKGNMVAKIIGGEQNKQIVTIYDPVADKKEIKKICCKYHDDDDCLEEKCCDECVSRRKSSKNSSFARIDPFILELGKKLTLMETEILKEAFRIGKEPKKTRLASIYNELKDKMDNTINKEIQLGDGIMCPLPTLEKDQRDVYYICGPAGSGKSHLSGNYLRQFKKMFPDREIVIFSLVEEEKGFDELNPIRITLNEKLTEQTYKEITNDLKNTCVVFDDIDTISNEKVRKFVLGLRDNILEIGRHDNIYVVATSHAISAWKTTRTLLQEATHVAFFPQSGGRFQIDYFLKRHMGLGTKGINKIYKLPSRWVIAAKRYPMYILHEKGIYMLSMEESSKKK
jgi:hypothetical protein